MTQQEKINAFIVWGSAIAAMLDELESNTLHYGNNLESIILKAHHFNQWFTPDQSKRALRAITLMQNRNRS